MSTCAGLAAYLFTESSKRSWRVAEALEYGIVGVNEGLVSTEVGPVAYSNWYNLLNYGCNSR